MPTRTPSEWPGDQRGPTGTSGDPGPPRRDLDLLLIHPPAFYDFRGRDDIYFPYLSTSGAVPITPLYEYFPIGFKSLQRYLSNRGLSVGILNLASLLLRYPDTDVRRLLQSVSARLIGVDLHWLVHVQGSLEIGRLVKEVHPNVPVIFGGISSTYYAAELVGYDFVDMVMKGYDTLEPMYELLRELKGARRFESVRNLTWKRDGTLIDNGLTHRPDEFSCGVDWTETPKEDDARILELLSVQNAGCGNSCGWCGGSREAFTRLYGQGRPIAWKPLPEIEYEFGRARSVAGIDRYYCYSASTYNEPIERLRFLLAQVRQTNLRAINYELFRLPGPAVIAEMARAHQRTAISLSPESHDLRVAKLAGRGVYTPDEMERWIDQALSLGIHAIDIWYFIGLPEQDEQSVLKTVEYCSKLLWRFKGANVVPAICPMIPFLDPGSTFFEHPDEHGYRVFWRTVEEHRRGMLSAALTNRINYETRWLDRSALVDVSYRAIRELVELKGEYGLLPRSVADGVGRKIEEAHGLEVAVRHADSLSDTTSRSRELRVLASEIQRQNNEVFSGAVSNQAFPIPRNVGGRWFDEMLYDADALATFV